MSVFNDLKQDVEKNLSEEVNGLSESIAYLLKYAYESKYEMSSVPEVNGKQIVQGGTSLEHRLMKSIGLVEIISVFDAYSKGLGHSLVVLTDKGKKTYKALAKEGYFKETE